MGNFLNSKKKDKYIDTKDDRITDADKAMLSLKTQRRKLEAERKRIEGLIERNKEVIKELLIQKKKDRAVLILKKIKLKENQIKTVETWLMTVEQLLGNIEMSVQQNQIFTALRTGADVMKELQQEVTIEDVDKLLEDTEEAKEYQEKINDALGGSLLDIEKDELLNELAELENQLLDEEALIYPKAPANPIKKEIEVSNEMPVKEEEEINMENLIPA